MKHFIPYLAVAILLSPANLWAVDKKAPSPADQSKAADAAMQQMLRKFDRDGDGKLSPQEQAAADQALLQAFPTAGAPVGNNPNLKPFDRDRDGRLNPAESRMARDYFDRMRSKGGGPQRGFDPTGGGSGQQPAAPAADSKAEKEKVSPLVKRFDKDGDGKLNASEKAAAQAELKKDKKKDKEDEKGGK